VSKTKIFVIDKNEEWADLVVPALEESGFSVSDFNDYEETVIKSSILEERPDLVVLGCVKISNNEYNLIDFLLEEKLHLLVLCTTLPQKVMRTVFLAGADDVTEKPFDPNRTVKTVNEVLKNISNR
jgi:DNA-binding response OmpR family regulator